MKDAVHFWFDLADPWSWLAMDDVRRAVQESGRPLLWHPVRLPPAVGFTNDSRDALSRGDLERAAAQRGLPVPRCDVPDQVLLEAMAAIQAVAPPDRGPLAEATMRAAWTGQGLPDAAASGEELAAATTEAETAGVFATPAVVVDDVVFWGADRVHFVRRALGLPGAAEPFPTARAGTTVTWFHDFSSPFSYLSSTQIDRFERETGATVERVPILLGALFKAIGTPMVPMQTFSITQQRWRLRDLMRWAEWWGTGFHWPEHFPLRTVSALRIAIAEPSATNAMYTAAWAHNRNIGDPEVLGSVLTEAGFDSAVLLAKTQDQAIKDQLRANTERAAARGVCGVPTFDLRGETLVWGQDRLDQIAALLAG